MTPTRLMLLSTVLLAACATAEDEASGGTWTQVAPPPLVIHTGAQDTGTLDTCGPAELCARSIDDCAVEMDPAICEDWYAVGDCRDMDAYTACNCDCEASEDTCDGYFACGQLCFIDHCEG